MTFHSAFICDAPVCPASVDAEDEPDMLSRGWIALQLVGDDDETEPHHFCSLDCVRDWLTGQAE